MQKENPEISYQNPWIFFCTGKYVFKISIMGVKEAAKGDTAVMDCGRKSLKIRLKLRGKLIVSFLVPVLLAFLIATIGGYYFLQGLNQDIQNLASVSATQINSNIDVYINQLYRLTNMSFSDDDLQKILKNAEGLKSLNRKREDTIHIQRFLWNIYAFLPDLYSVWLKTNTGEVYTEGENRYVGSSYDVRQEPWYQEAAENPGNFTVIGKRISSQTMGDMGQREVFTVARRIVGLDNRELGFFILDMKYESFQSIFKALEHDKNAQILLVDKNNKLIYSSNPDLTVGTVIREDDSFLPERDSSKYFMVSDTSQYTGWKISVAIPRVKLFGKLETMVPTLLIVFFSCLVFSVVFYFILSYMITEPVKKLAGSMRKVEDGDFSVTVKSSAQDEIGELSRGFDHMISQINTLIEKTVEAEVREKKSEYAALQSQINPHFLYNTLEAIRMKCILQKEPELAGIINTFSNLFRMIIDRKERFVPLKSELKHVEQYMEIQNFRFCNKYVLSVQAGEGALECFVPKLLLQPLVENSIFHGLEMKSGVGHIRISIKKEKLLTIVVEDDGIGIEEKTYQKLLRSLENPEDLAREDSVGLNNVNSRIRLLGGQYNLKIFSEAGQGTKVEIILPVLSENEVKNVV